MSVVAERIAELFTHACTGSWTGMEFVAFGDTVPARFPGIGEASVRIA